MPYRLGVDLGTTYTAAAADESGTPTMVGLGNRALQVPSVLFVKEDGDLLVGEAAEFRGLTQPDRVVREFKRRLGDKVPMLVGGQAFSPEDLTARLLRWVVEVAASRFAGPPAEIVLTHPANWGAYKLECLDQAAVLAGVAPVTKLPEPVAAAAQFAARTQVAVEDRLVIYDLGGGTFDVCVVVKTIDGFRLLGTPEGIEHMGGVDVDEAIFRQVLDAVREQVAELDLDHPETTVGLARLRRSCVDAKEELSNDVEAVVPVTLPGLTTSVRVTRPQLEAAIRPALRETVAATSRAMRSAGIEASEVRSVVLVGGSSRIPLVKEMVETELGVPVNIGQHPKHDVALGAVAYVAGLAASSDSATVLGTPQGVVPPGGAGHAGEAGPPVLEDTHVLGRTRRRRRQRAAETAGSRTAEDDLAGRGRRRGLLIGLVALLVILGALGYTLVRVLGGADGDGTGGPPSTSSSPSVTGSPPVLSEDLLLTPAALADVDPVLSWTVDSSVSASPSPNGAPGVQSAVVCLDHDAVSALSGPQQAVVRALNGDGVDAPSVRHEALAFGTDLEALYAYEAASLAFGDCGQPDALIESGRLITGLGDAALGLVVVVDDGTRTVVHSVVLIRTGRVLDVVEGLRLDRRLSVTRLAQATAGAVNAQCAVFGGGCAATVEVTGGPPPAGAAEPGLLTRADLPAVGEDRLGWDSEPVGPPEDEVIDGTGCESVAWADIDQETVRAKSYELSDADLALHQLVVVRKTEGSATRLARRVRDGWDACASQRFDVTVSELEKISGSGAEDAEITGWTAEVSHPVPEGIVRSRVGVVAVGDKVVFTLLTPVEDLDLTDRQFDQLTLRAGERASQAP